MCCPGGPCEMSELCVVQVGHVGGMDDVLSRWAMSG